MSFLIRGIGTAVPLHTMSLDESLQLAHQVICKSDHEKRLLSILYRKAGVSNRHSVLPHQIALNWLPDESETAPSGAKTTTLGPTTGERMRHYAEQAPPLAERAARQALIDAQADPRATTHLVTVSCTGFDAPGLDSALIARLELPPTTQRIQVGFMGCHGAINGLRVAQALTTADPEAQVLLVAVELCSLHYRFRFDPEQIVANALFADGAAAVVGVGRRAETSGCQRPDDSWRVRATGSCLIPDSRDAMTWRIGDHGFEMTLQGRVPELIQAQLRPWLTKWLAGFGHTLQSIGSWAIHPGGPRILSAVEESLGLAREATAVSHEILANYGNMSSPTVLFILDRLRKSNAKRPCVALGFGPGMFAEAALLA